MRIGTTEIILFFLIVAAGCTVIGALIGKAGKRRDSRSISTNGANRDAYCCPECGCIITDTTNGYCDQCGTKILKN